MIRSNARNFVEKPTYFTNYGDTSLIALSAYVAAIRLTSRGAGPDARLADRIAYRGAKIDAGLADPAIPRPAAPISS